MISNKCTSIIGHITVEGFIVKGDNSEEVNISNLDTMPDII
jgi:hypothetical protein